MYKFTTPEYVVNSGSVYVEDQLLKFELLLMSQFIVAVNMSRLLKLRIKKVQQEIFV